MLRLARESIQQRLLGEETTTSPPADSPFHQSAATFVTLKIAGQLRGCIGNLQPVGSLWDSVRNNAINAAFYDSRFPPLGEAELAEVEIDISVLSEPLPLEYSDAEDLLAKLRPGEDGVVLRLGRAGATFLPQVWLQLPSAEQFLDNLCWKAGLSRDSWRSDHPEVLVYNVQCFSEEQE